MIAAALRREFSTRGTLAPPSDGRTRKVALNNSTAVMNGPSGHDSPSENHATGTKHTLFLSHCQPRSYYRLQRVCDLGDHNSVALLKAKLEITRRPRGHNSANWKKLQRLSRQRHACFGRRGSELAYPQLPAKPNRIQPKPKSREADAAMPLTLVPRSQKTTRPGAQQTKCKLPLFNQPPSAQAYSRGRDEQN